MRALQITILGILIFSQGLTGQPTCQFYHYSTEDGLPQYTIMDIMQDQKGFIWLATWDGLSKYDGFTFRNYKVGPEHNYFIKSNRVQKIHEDKYGRIWFESYDGEIHCLNPIQENFWGLQKTDKLQNKASVYNRIKIMPSGKVWLLSEKEGCVLVKDSIFQIELFTTSGLNLKSNRVNGVFEDRELNSWILTDNGISMISANKNQAPRFYFFNAKIDNKHEKQGFFSALEIENDIFFGAQQGKLWRYSKIDGKFTLIKTPANSQITEIHPTQNGDYILVTAADGFMTFNNNSENINLFNSKNSQINSDHINKTYFDKSGNFWFETTEETGTYRYNFTSKKIEYHKVEVDDTGANLQPPFGFVFEDIHGRIWVQPKGGGFSLFNKESGKLEHFYNNPGSKDRKFSNIIHSAFSDRQGNLWMCTRSHGLEKVVFNKNYFHVSTVNPDFYAENSNDVRAVYEDNERRLWVATKDRRITVYDKNRNIIGRLSSEGKIGKDAKFTGMAYSIMQDKSGNIWLGTKGEGLFLLKKSGVNNFKIQQFKNNPKDPYSLSENSIYSIFEDKSGKIWIGTYGGGLNLLKIENDVVYSFIHHGNEIKNFPIKEAARVRFINQDNHGNILVGSTGGLVVFKSNFRKPSDIKFRTYSRIPGNVNGLSNNDIHSICITSRNEMFLATFGGGINKAVKYDADGFPLIFKTYNSKKGLPSDVTLSIIEDEQGKLWVSNENNLSKFDPQTESIETYTEIKSQMLTNSFSEASTCRLRNNELFFGFSGGLLSFFPGQILNSKYRPYIAFTNFHLFNIEQNIGENSPLKSHIDNLEKLVLTHKQNFFSIEYASLDFINPENITFAYKLEGFDNEWNYVQKQRLANYTNLPRGEYIFRVKSTNSEGVWVDNERQIKIVVKPSFWETIWAYLIYFLLFIALTGSIFRVLITIYKLKSNVEMEKKISEMKLRFFTDISHEIRTPLTMITAPVDHLLTDPKTPEHIRKHLQLISQNTGRLLRLVNQILDFRKIQFMQLKVYETELAPLVEDICGNFNTIASDRNISFRFINNARDEKVWVDPDCIDKIVMNLLSNAFKFTPQGRAIQATVFQDEKSVGIEIKDEGPGLSKEKQRNLFTRFTSFNSDKSKPSTGIGLSMVKDLVDKHNAKIYVETEENKGTTITVHFLRGIEHFGKNVEIVAAGNISTRNQAEYECKNDAIADNVLPDNGTKTKTKNSILIVEDDADLRGFIRSVLEDEYLVIEAEDGISGKKLALEEIPDFIVSDIMMPGMNGVELLQELRTNLITSHIPVVLLTAKTTIESKLEGLAYGADDYITKPFSVTYFKARIANLISQRKHLQELFLSNPAAFTGKSFEPQPFTITSHDESMMAGVIKAIEDNMDNFTFSVDDMRESAGMSRSAFFKKIKSLTGLAPVEFVRDIKMKRAAQLLSSGEYRVKEVTYMIGFSDSKYFAKCFKEKYGVTPIEYKQGKE